MTAAGTGRLRSARFSLACGPLLPERSVEGCRSHVMRAKERSPIFTKRRRNLEFCPTCVGIGI